jgi:putative membrane protein
MVSPVKLVIKTALNVLLVYALDNYLPQYFTVFGGVRADIVIGILLTILNLFVRPILDLVSLPFKFISMLMTDIAVNALFLWLVYELTLKMNPNVLVMEITGGVTGWIVVSSVLGFFNWLVKIIL